MIEHAYFPTSQLTRVFPITRSLVLSCLFFSPYPTTPGTIFIAIRVTDADEFERCTAVYRNKAWPSASLHFIILEDNTRTPTVCYCFAAKRTNDDKETPPRSARAVPSPPCILTTCRRSATPNLDHLDPSPNSCSFSMGHLVPALTPNSATVLHLNPTPSYSPSSGSHGC